MKTMKREYRVGDKVRVIKNFETVKNSESFQIIEKMVGKIFVIERMIVIERMNDRFFSLNGILFHPSEFEFVEKYRQPK